MKHIKIPRLSVFLLAVAMLFLPCSTACSTPALSPVAPCAALTQTAVEDMSAYRAEASSAPDTCPCAASGTRRLIPGGMPFGVKFTTDGVLVVGFCDIDTDAGSVNPARDAGLRTGDVIVRCNDAPVRDAATLCRVLEAGHGQPFTLTLLRDGTEQTLTLTPAYSRADDKYKSGIWIRDGGAGIGTVTFIDPTDGTFAGLGHGICDGDTGQLIPLGRGAVMDVTISGIVRGQPGTPGEVKGYFNNDKLGSVLGNTECGVYGLFATRPAPAAEALPIGTRAELHAGDAELLCALDSGTVTRYHVTISAIDPTARSNKCFTVTVTDPALIEKTGGIVQGMSGSPLIQDGKLVGAVTHVLVNDPTRGYGIFIENMLDAAQLPPARAS